MTKQKKIFENFLASASREDVLDDIDAIIDKIESRGMLVTATGEQYLDTKIQFQLWGQSKDKQPYLVVSIDGENSIKIDNKEEFERIAVYILDKVSDALANWDDETQKNLKCILGCVVLFNDKHICTIKV